MTDPDQRIESLVHDDIETLRGQVATNTDELYSVETM